MKKLYNKDLAFFYLVVQTPILLEVGSLNTILEGFLLLYTIFVALSIKSFYEKMSSTCFPASNIY